MWALTAPITILTITGTDILGKIINVTLSSISTTFLYMSESSENTSIKKYYNELEELDIQLKLSLVNNWIKKVDLQEKDSNFELIYKSISESCQQIGVSVDLINAKIENHFSKWFHNWRSFDLDEEIKLIKKQTNILNNRLNLINFKNNI
jgi:hypothetical protein